MATGPQGAKTATMDEDSRFSIPFPTPALYSVRAELSGFAPVERNDVNVSLGQAVDLRFISEVGDITNTVTVVGSIAQIDTTNTTTGAVIDSDFVQTVPVGRRISDVIYMAADVSSSGSGASTISSGTGRQGPRHSSHRVRFARARQCVLSEQPARGRGTQVEGSGRHQVRGVPRVPGVPEPGVPSS